MILAGDFRKGITVEIDGQVWSIADFQHVKPGKGAAFVRTKLKNVMTVRWQKLLKLGEWKIAVGLSNREKLQGQPGTLSYSREKGQALITLAQNADTDVLPFASKEDEIIVRKMLDLRFEMISATGQERIYFERTLNIIAELLVALDTRNTVFAEQEIIPQKKESPRQMPRVIET